MKHFFLLAITLVWVCILVVLYIAYLIFHNPPTFVVKNFSYEKPIAVETPVLHPGDTLVYQLQYCKFTDVVPSSKTYLMDGQQIPLTTQPSKGLLKGCHTIERDVTIPETINPGTYYYDKELDYQVNPLNTQKVYYYTDYFQVVAKEVATSTVPTLATSTLPRPIINE